ncbi:MAG: metal-dependent transcriptional regulator [Candidatus Fimenecus sp.]
MTNNREDYLVSIFKLQEREGKATNKRIAECMKISKPSASEMLKKLESDKLIYFKGNNIKLTDSGIDISKRILSCHRLWEMFLLDRLDYNWQDVHAQADLLEHITSDTLKDKLNAFLGYPKCCPHGSIIYENWSEPADKGIYMGDLIAGQKAKIIKVDDETTLLRYLDRFGLKLNDRFEVISRDEFDFSMLININGEKISIAQKALKHIYVRVSENSLHT